MQPVITPFTKRTAKQLFENASAIEAMAATATTLDVKQALERLAVRFRTLALKRQAEESAAASTE